MAVKNTRREKLSKYIQKVKETAARRWSVRSDSGLVTDENGYVVYFTHKVSAKQHRDEMNMGLTDRPFKVTKGPDHPGFQ